MSDKSNLPLTNNNDNIIGHDWRPADILICKDKPSILPVYIVKGNKYTLIRKKFHNAINYEHGSFSDRYVVFILDDQGVEVGLSTELFINVSLNQ